MHPSAQRLFEAIYAMRGIDGAREPGRVAVFLGESAATITNWKARGVSKAGTLKLYDMLGVSPSWVTSGSGEMVPSMAASNVRTSLGGNTQATDTLSGVPLISWVQAGTWSDIADPYTVGEAEDWLPCPIKHGPRSYCLRVRGDSMHNPGGRPSYANGDIIFVDPDRGANAGDRVIVRMDDQREATFKQLVVEDGRRLLKALNPEWQPRYVEINGDATITGVIIGKWVPE